MVTTTAPHSAGHSPSLSFTSMLPKQQHKPHKAPKPYKPQRVFLYPRDDDKSSVNKDDPANIHADVYNTINRNVTTLSDTVDSTTSSSSSTSNNNNSNNNSNIDKQIDSNAVANHDYPGWGSNPTTVSGIVVLSVGVLIIVVAAAFYFAKGKSWKTLRSGKHMRQDSEAGGRQGNGDDDDDDDGEAALRALAEASKKFYKLDPNMMDLCHRPHSVAVISSTGVSTITTTTATTASSSAAATAATTTTDKGTGTSTRLVEEVAAAEGNGALVRVANDSNNLFGTGLAAQGRRRSIITLPPPIHVQHPHPQRQKQLQLRLQQEQQQREQQQRDQQQIGQDPSLLCTSTAMTMVVAPGDRTSNSAQGSVSSCHSTPTTAQLIHPPSTFFSFLSKANKSKTCSTASASNNNNNKSFFQPENSLVPYNNSVTTTKSIEAATLVMPALTRTIARHPSQRRQLEVVQKGHRGSGGDKDKDKARWLFRKKNTRLLEAPKKTTATTAGTLAEGYPSMANIRVGLMDSTASFPCSSSTASCSSSALVLAADATTATAAVVAAGSATSSTTQLFVAPNHNNNEIETLFTGSFPPTTAGTKAPFTATTSPYPQLKRAASTCASSVLGLYGSPITSPVGSMMDASSIKGLYAHSTKSTLSRAASVTMSIAARGGGEDSCSHTSQPNQNHSFQLHHQHQPHPLPPPDDDDIDEQELFYAKVLQSLVSVGEGGSRGQDETENNNVFHLTDHREDRGGGQAQ